MNFVGLFGLVLFLGFSAQKMVLEGVLVAVEQLALAILVDLVLGLRQVPLEACYVVVGGFPYLIFS